MNIRVISIEPITDPKTFNVIVLIGTNQHQFAVSVETDMIDNQEVQITNGDDLFWKKFRLNQIVAVEICKLVSKVYNRQLVELPADVGDFYPGEIESASLPKVS